MGFGVSIVDEGIVVDQTPTSIGDGSVTMDLEAAEREFDRFVEDWDIDGEVDDTWTQEDREAFEEQKRRLVRRIGKGWIVIGDDSSVTIKLRHSDDIDLSEVVLRVPKGNAYVKLDIFKERENVKRMTSMLGSMSGQNPVMFAKMDARDLKPALAVATLFIGS